ncbi:MAG TPA: tRNA (adenosine(37)-N6)-threonylcarbamoyltransferase complex dimerization subunit type 1 TsaB [Candidatus Polarisedimenticolaceae bacterium]|nr:tRNA (adenosine(37)-N6)-threonylcarbamoyltransferase complex dimerization subunit type 1 TsaB [Candidatus Polarisedimenticolaceae bacterium]
MTRAVALDTTTWWGGVALVVASHTGVETIAEAGLRVAGSHAAHLLRVLEALLAEAGWERSAVDLFVATHGPGSFTGIRIGLGTVRGLALAADRAAVGVGTLEAMAEAHGPDVRERVPVMDAGRGEVYAARFDATGSPPTEREAPWVGSPLRLLQGEAPAVLFGTGVAPHAALLRERGWTGPAGAVPTGVAAGAARLAILRHPAGTGSDGLAPLYLRPADAEAGTRAL